LALTKLGIAIEASISRITTTRISSINVNPLDFFMFLF
jgi:hypothetical protein